MQSNIPCRRHKKTAPASRLAVSTFFICVLKGMQKLAHPKLLSKPDAPNQPVFEYGVGDGARTRDLKNHNLPL